VLRPVRDARATHPGNGRGADDDLSGLRPGVPMGNGPVGWASAAALRRLCGEREGGCYSPCSAFSVVKSSIIATSIARV
jgi:hypothetical protein